jgi:hypothetical protein
MKTCPAIAACALVLALAACGGGGTPATAASLASRIRGCAGVTVNTPAVIEVQDVTCTLPDGDQIEVATFPSSADETQWISDGGSPDSPDPDYIGCCVEGSGWAAVVGGLNGVLTDYYDITHALGGREVTG